MHAHRRAVGTGPGAPVLCRLHMSAASGSVHDREPVPGASLAALQDIILTVGSTLDLPTVLQHVVEVIAEATGQTDSYIFLYDEDSDDLVLSAATESVATPYVGVLRIPLGEGVTGFVGASRETYVIERDLHADPRFMLHGGLGEERYDAMICVPIVSRSDRLVGVVSVWSPARDRFTPEHVRLAEWIAVVVAGAIENARLHATVSRRTRVLERMAELSAMTTSGLATARLLDLTTELVREVGAADLAVLLVRDASGTDRMILKSVGTELEQGGERLQGARRELLAVDADVRRRGMAWHVAAEDVRTRLAKWFETAATAPLRIAGDELGLLCCYRVADRPFTTEDQALLSTIAVGGSDLPGVVGRIGVLLLILALAHAITLGVLARIRGEQEVEAVVQRGPRPRVEAEQQGTTVTPVPGQDGRYPAASPSLENRAPYSAP